MLLLLNTCTGCIMHKHHIAMNLQILTLFSGIRGCITVVTRIA